MKKQIIFLIALIFFTLFLLWYLSPNSLNKDKLEEKINYKNNLNFEIDGLIDEKNHQISEQYLEKSKYPIYSIPISKDEVQGYTGNTFNKVSYPLTEDLTLVIDLPKYHYEIDEDIPISVEINGRDIFNQKIMASIQGNNETITLKKDDFNTFSGNLKSKKIGEIKLIIHTKIDGKEYDLHTSVIIDPKLGKITNLGLIEIKGNELIIPLNFDEISKNNAYRISGNLYKGDQPIAHFFENFYTKQSNTANIKIYGSLLVGVNFNDLSIKDLVLEKLPKGPDERNESTYLNGIYNLSTNQTNTLKNIPYENKNIKETAVFLKSLS